MSQVVVLNADYTILSTVPIRKARLYLYKGKAELIKAVGSVPRVVRFLKMIIAMHKAGLRWTRQNVHIRDKFTCLYCGTRLNKNNITVDHVIPKAQGGKDIFENTVACCFPCNNRKGDKTPNQASMSFIRRGFRPFKPTVMEFYMIRFAEMGIEDTLIELGVY